jgi:hypothetical protein
MIKFKPGDKVRYFNKEWGCYIYGEITLIGIGFYEGIPKVMWGSPLYEYDYWYSKSEPLELMLPENTPDLTEE